MKKKTEQKKLVLAKETLATLDADARMVRGGDEWSVSCVTCFKSCESDCYDTGRTKSCAIACIKF